MSKKSSRRSINTGKTTPLSFSKSELLNELESLKAEYFVPQQIVGKQFTARQLEPIFNLSSHSLKDILHKLVDDGKWDMIKRCKLTNGAVGAVYWKKRRGK